MKMHGLRFVWLFCAGLLLVFPHSGVMAQEDLVIEEEPAAEAPAPKAAEAAPAAKAEPAPKPAPAKVAPSVIRRVQVVPVSGRIEIRVSGSGSLKPRIWKIEEDKKLVMDFEGTRYMARRVILGAPLGEIKKVRGAQFQPEPKLVSRIVLELGKFVNYTESARAGAFTLVLETPAVAGPEEEAEAAPAAAAAPAAKARAAPAPAPAEAPAPVAPSARSNLLHTIVNDLPDRVRLVATADGLLRYKLSSEEARKEITLFIYDVNLKWSPPRLSVKEGPIREVTASEVKKPVPHVEMVVKLRDMRPYHVKMNQNQVILEVEKPTVSDADLEISAGGPDISHKITLNVQNEDLPSLIKGLAFEAGFENVLVNKSVSGMVTISLREVPFAKAMNLILSPNEYLWKVERNIFKVGRSDDFEKELSTSIQSGGTSGGGEGGISTRVFRLRYISVFELGGAGAGGTAVVTPSSVVSILTSLVVDKTRGQVVVDRRTNSIVITDATSNMARMATIIRQLDVPLPQVMIDARLISVSQDKIKELGVAWSVEKATPANPTLSAQLQNPLDTTAMLRTGFLGPGFNLDASLASLEQNQAVKVILNPRVATVHDRMARIDATDTISYLKTETTTDQYGVPRVYTSVAQMSVPITLQVVPHVNPNQTVGLDVNIVSTAVTGAADPGTAPPTTQQTAVTQLVVKSGETAVIGGLLRDQAEKGVDKVPLLGDLPWFMGGGLFRKETTRLTKVELVLFLMPRIVDDI